MIKDTKEHTHPDTLHASSQALNFKNEDVLRESHKIQNIFITMVFAVFFIVNAALAFFVINWSRNASILMFAFLVFFNFSFSLMFSKRVLSFVVEPDKLPKLESLTSEPKVAILYATMNDVVPESLTSIQQTYPSDVYVLDDSTSQEKREIVDRIADGRGFRILRREHRQGFKAGAINNWIQNHGHDYEYIVLLDSDSYLPPDWVGNALEYAEHPSNSGVAVFQGLINIWNLDNRFIRTLSPLHVLGQDIWEKRLANRLDAVFCYGHNVLVRMDPVREIGGFIEGYVSEDFATATRLAEKGYKSRFVPIHTYEAMPENIRGFIKRQNKWTRGSMEFFSFARASNLSLIQRLLLLQTPLGHLAYIVIMATMFLTIYGYYSTTEHLIAFASNLVATRMLYILSIPLFRYVIATSIVSGILIRVKLHQLGVSNSTFMRHQLLSKAIGAIMLPYEVKTILKYVVNQKLSFPVTPKSETPLSFRETLSISKVTILIMALLTIGLIWINPLGLIYNVTWLTPFFISPIIIYHFSKATYVDTTRENDFEMISMNDVTISASCINSQSEKVSIFLNSITQSVTTM